MFKGSFRKNNRKVHYWLSAIIAFPLLVVILTGLMLQYKKYVPWIQPTTVTTVHKIPSVSFQDVFLEIRKIESLNINTWSDIDRIDVRPAKGIIKVRLKNNWEVQVNPSTAEVLQVAYRRSDIIEQLHDGSFFGKITQFWVYVPTAIALLILLLSGLYMFFRPLLIKIKTKR